jgi:hypothetical protein
MSRASSSWRDSVRQACATSACRLGNSNTTRRSVLSPVRYLVADSDGDIDPDMEGLTEAEEEAHQDYLIAVDKWNLLSVHTALHKKRPRWYCEFCPSGTPVRQEQALQRTASGHDTSSNEAAVGTELLQDAVAADSLEGSAVDVMHSVSRDVSYDTPRLGHRRPSQRRRLRGKTMVPAPQGESMIKRLQAIVKEAGFHNLNRHLKTLKRNAVRQWLYRTTCRLKTGRKVVLRSTREVLQFSDTHAYETRKGAVRGRLLYDLALRDNRDKYLAGAAASRWLSEAGFPEPGCYSRNGHQMSISDKETTDILAAVVFLTSIGIRAKALTWGILADWSVTQVTEYVISTNGDWETFLPISLQFTAVPTCSSPGTTFQWRFRGREHESASLKLLAE